MFWAVKKLYSGSIINLLFNLQHMHPIAYNEVIKDQQIQHIPRKMSKQLSITQVFVKGTPFPKISL